MGVSQKVPLAATDRRMKVQLISQQNRQAAYYIVGIASSGLSGLLAYGIDKMDGIAGIAGWRWIFIIVHSNDSGISGSQLTSTQEGSVSSTLAVIAFFTLVDLPEAATKRNLLGVPAFLSKEEAAVLIAHVERDRADATTEKFSVKDMLYHLRDWKVMTPFHRTHLQTQTY